MELKNRIIYFKILLGLLPCLFSAFYWIHMGLFDVGFLGEDFAYLRYVVTKPKPWLWSMIVPNEFGQYRPLGHQLYFLLTRFLFSLNPTPYHLVSIFLHMGNTFLVYSLLGKLFREEDNTANFWYLSICSCLAFFWSIQGYHTKAIFWISASNNLLYGMFSLLVLNFILDQKTDQRKTQMAFILALASKEFAILIPIFSILFMNLSEKSWRKKFDKMLPLFFIAFVYLGYRLAFYQGTSPVFTPKLSTLFLPAIQKYLAWSLDSHWSLSMVFHSFFFFLAIKNIAARAYLIFPMTLFFLCLWPEHVMPEFLYLAGFGVFAAILVIIHGAEYIFSKSPRMILQLGILVALGIFFLQSPTSAEIKSNLMMRSGVFTKNHYLLSEIPNNMAVSGTTNLFWSSLNQALGSEVIHAPWYIQLHWPERFPCLVENWRRSFSAEGKASSKIQMGPELFQCQTGSEER